MNALLLNRKYLGYDGIVLPDSLVLVLLFDSVGGREGQSLSVATQHRLAFAHVGGGQGETASSLSGGHWVVSDVTQGCGATKPLACCTQLTTQHKRKHGRIKLVS